MADEVTGEIMENQLALVEKAKLDGAVATAHMYPRPTLQKTSEECHEIMMSGGIRLTEDCYYMIPGRMNKKTGKMSEPYTGPNIRLCEMWAAKVGNLATGIGFAQVDRGEMRVTVRAFAHDLETNVRIEEEYSTRILWGGADGEKNALDRARSYAYRNVVTRMYGVHLRLLAEDAMDFVAKTPDVEGLRGKILAAFEAKGVTQEELLGYLKIESADEITGKMIADLRGMYGAEKDGWITFDSVFHPEKEETIEGSVDLDKLNAKEPPPERDDSVPKAPVDQEVKRPPEDEEKPSDVLSDAVAEAEKKSKPPKKEKPS